MAQSVKIPRERKQVGSICMCVYKFILHTWARKFKTIHNFGFSWRSNPQMSRRFAFNSKTGKDWAPKDIKQNQMSYNLFWITHPTRQLGALSKRDSIIPEIWPMYLTELQTVSQQHQPLHQPRILLLPNVKLIHNYKL